MSLTVVGLALTAIPAALIMERIGRRNAFIASALNIGFAGFWGSLLVSTVGAIVLLAIVGMFRGRRAL